ncbi:MAG: class I SAM-dependent methyltransferase [Actinomycetota bacterium]|nr:class I SAM-dependent methyltransferase [Actinomycetota bacterium]
MSSSQEPRGPQLVKRYRAFFHIPESAVVTEEMVLEHWDLERQLTDELKASTPEDRWAVFEEAYTRLYRELDWMNKVIETANRAPDEFQFGDWLFMIGSPPRSVYEVGSGRGELIRFLATQGYACKGTEVTRQRGEMLAEHHPNLTWGTTDGIHLGRFEEASSFDAVISDQVIEHLHPDDIVEHFKGAIDILRPGGSYSFVTPHRLYGPLDLSRVFGKTEPECMHLKEYTYREIVVALRDAGFADIRVPLKLPRKVRRALRGHPRPRLSRAYLRYLMVMESVLGAIPRQTWRNAAARAAKLILFEGILINATKR